MSIKCKLGFHPWGGCKCHKCGKTRNKSHSWSNDNNGCKCTVCGLKRDGFYIKHEWRGCKCIICSIERDEHHSWHLDCTQCPICNKTRNEQHDWSKDCEKCSKCATTRNNQHDWTKNIEICSICGKAANEGSFIDIRDGKNYKWVRFGKQIVMMQNFAFKPGFGNFYGNEPDKRGYLYDWETALKITPMGWHLPTESEWLSVIHEFEEYCWKHFDQDTPSLIKGYTISNGFYDIKGNINFDSWDRHFWSASESTSNGAIGFIFKSWYDYASGDGDFKKGIFDRNLGLSVIYFRNN
jgi:uncharacterized protein (TIGR02145 family)